LAGGASICSMMISVTGDRKLFMKWVRLSASSFSDKLVNPRMSQNMIVMVRA